MRELSFFMKNIITRPFISTFQGDYLSKKQLLDRIGKKNPYYFQKKTMIFL